jgi:glycosyltransferase involved in cell wall biosynthesis
VALSKAIKDDWIKLEKSLKIDIVPSAYIKESFPDEKISISNRKDLKIVGFIGAIVDEHKGVCTILESAKLLQNREDIHFVLIGNGIDYNLCVNRSRYLKNITFLGFQNNPQKFINDFDVFVFPSNHEGLGSTLLDVMRFGKPIIASSVGGIVDLIKDSENGYLIEPQKPEILKNKILGILSKPELA